MIVITYNSTTGEIAHAAFTDDPRLPDAAEIEGLEHHTPNSHAVATLKYYPETRAAITKGTPSMRDTHKYIDGRLVPKADAEVAAEKRRLDAEIVEARIIALRKDLDAATAEGLTAAAARIQAELDAARADLAALG